MTIITDQEWDAFVEKGIVSDERINYLTNQIKINIPLSTKEQAMFADNVTIINQKLVAENSIENNVS